MRGPGHIHRASSAQMSETGLNTLAHGHPAAATDGRSLSISQPSQPGTPLFSAQQPTSMPQIDGVQQCIIDSSAYFIRTELGSPYSAVSSRPTPAREILIFGDVEPDTLSLSPRTAHVWQEAAPKIAAGILTGVFIECSYTDAQGDAVLFGHLAPRHLIAELQYLADMVREARKELEREREELRQSRKRKRSGPNGFLSGNEDEHSRRRSRSRQKSVAASQLTAAALSARTSTTTTVETTTNNTSAAFATSTTPQLLSPGERLYTRDYLDTPVASATSTPGPGTPCLHPQQQAATHQQPPTPSLSISVAGGTSSASPTTGAITLDGAGAEVAAHQPTISHHPLPHPHPLSRRASFMLGPSEHAPAPTTNTTATVTASAATTTVAAAAAAASTAPPPLKGLRVIIIHVKDTHTDGPLVGERILAELQEHERVCAEQFGKPLGCEFVISKHGRSYWF
ncbi:cAMP phosphodiesterases class-II-domain-containing protein [Phyllosticta citrichinensis]